MIDKKIKNLVLLFCVFDIALVILPLGISNSKEHQSLQVYKINGEYQQPDIEYLNQIDGIKYLDEILLENKLKINKFNQITENQERLISNIVEIEIEGSKGNMINFLKRLEATPRIIVEKIVFLEEKDKYRLEIKIPRAAYEKQ